MGIGPGRHRSEEDSIFVGMSQKPNKCSKYRFKNKLPNPDPANFTIRRIEKIKKYTWVLVNYPDCNTYGGNKILIYKDVSARRLKIYGNLDPHFSESGLTPVARFKPDPEGVRLSIKFCETC